MKSRCVRAAFISRALGSVHFQAHCWLNPPPCPPNTGAPGSLLLISWDQTVFLEAAHIPSHAFHVTALLMFYLGFALTGTNDYFVAYVI